MYWHCGVVRRSHQRIAGRTGYPTAGNYDLEVFGLPAAELVPILESVGTVHLVGESFAVYKIVPRRPGGVAGRVEIDVSLPREQHRIV